jgi:hypothetical protein
MEMMLPQFSSPSVIWVPCLPDYENGKFIPVYNLSNIPSSLQEKVPSLPRGGIKYKLWRHDEDSKLRELVQELGIKKWAKIATELNSVFNNGRKGKNCRERWNNHLDPEINKGEWTFEEDLILLEKHREMGRKWSVIAKLFKGRTENSVKNRWNTLIKSTKTTLGNTPSEVAAGYLISHLSGLVHEKKEE